MSRAALDLTKCKDVYRHGEITICMTWIDAGNDGSEPCMVIIPTRRMDKNKARPFVIPLSSLFKYDDPKYLAFVCSEIAMLLGLDGSRSAIRIGDLINNYMDELGQMPNRPEIDRYVAADAILTDLDGKTTEFAITDHH